MFTIDDLHDIAIQIEQNGAATYSKASEVVVDPETASLLRWMAEEEERHRQWFAGLPKTRRTLSAADREVEDMGRSLLRDILKSGSDFLHDREALETAPDIDAVLTSAGRFEQETILFYEFLLALLEEEDAISRLREIIAEERRHLELLQQLLHSAAGSRQ